MAADAPPVQGDGRESAAPARRFLYASLFSAGASLKDTIGAPAGPRTLFMSYGLFALLPVVALNGALALIQLVSSQANRDPFAYSNGGYFDFNDINPYTIVIAGLMQLLVAVPHVWLFSWCLAFGMKLAGGGEEELARARAAGWREGATIYAFWILIIGGLLFVDVLWTKYLPIRWSLGRSGLVEDILNFALFAYPIAVVVLGTRAGTGAPWPRALVASVVGGLGGLVAFVPISVVLTSIAVLVIRAS